MKNWKILVFIGSMALVASLVAASAQADQVIADDLIVTGSLCTGFDCVNNESFGFSTIRLKENNLRIEFQDTSTTAGFPSTDWWIIANDSASGGSNYFGVDNLTNGKSVLRIYEGDGSNGAVTIGEGSTNSGAGTFSVGSVAAPRRITNVADGTGGTDAVNLNQLNATAASTLTAANAYTDTSSANTLTAANTYANTVGTNTLAAAKGYTDSFIDVNNAGGYANPSATGDNSIAVGAGAVASASNTVALGINAQATGTNAVAIGSGAIATGSVAVGTEARAADGGSALGDYATATGTASVAIGQNAKSTGSNSAAIGSNSTDGGQNNVVSMGSFGNERKITNVASGVDATDAANISQLQSTLAAANHYTNTQINELSKEAHKGIAGSIAMSRALMPLNPGESALGFGLGSSGGEAAAALSMQYYTKVGIHINAGASFSGSDVQVGGGVGIKF